MLRRGLLGKVSMLRALLQPILVLRGWGSGDFQVRGGFALLVRVLATLPVSRVLLFARSQTDVTQLVFGAGFH